MKLADYLREHAIPAADFARLIGEKKSTVHGWVTGRRSPRSVSKMVKVERATNGAVMAADFVDANQGKQAA